MKIIWLTTKEKNNFIGRTPLFGLSDSLIKMGHEVTVILASKVAEESQGYIQYVRNPFSRLIKFKLKLAFCLPWWAICKKPDFIIVEWQSAFVPAILIILSKLMIYRNNLIHDIRTIPVPPFYQHNEKIFKLCVNISKKYFLGITTITEALKNKICSEYHIPAEKVGVWSSGVDLNLFYPRDGSAKRNELGLDGKFILFYHGSVGYERGVIEIVKAFCGLENDDIHFFILGSGAEMENIRKLKNKQHLHNVHIHLPVAYKEVPNYIAMSDICIVPLPDKECWRVSSPLKVMEYLAMGKPIILTDIVAHREIIKNRNDAFFIPDLNKETLVTAIRGACHRKVDLLRMGEAGLRNAEENCSWHIRAERLVKYLHKIRA